jgi:hypothetical protein
MVTDEPSHAASPPLTSGLAPPWYDLFFRPCVPWVIVGLGIVLRIIAYLHNPSLWLDEALLAHNLIRRDFAALMGTLDHAQIAPLLFLWAERCAVLIAGSGEMALRFLPFLAGCATMPLALWVGRRCLSPGALRIALLLLAISPPLIDYAVQVKPYALDVVFALLILGVTLRLMESPERGRDFLFLGMLGALGPWISFPAGFVMASALTVLFLTHGGSGSDRWRVRLGGLLLLCLVSYAVFALSRYDWRDSGGLRETWQRFGGFAPFPPRSGIDVHWYLRAAVRAIGMPGGLPVRSVGVLLAALGITVLAVHRHWSVLGLLGLPIVFALAASAVALYPFTGRLILYLAPALTFFVATGLAWLWSETARALSAMRLRPRPRVPWAGPLLLAVTLAATVLSLGVGCDRALRRVQHPIAREEVRELVATLRRDARPDDVVYVYYGAEAAFDYYAPRPAWRVHYGVGARRNPQRYAADVERLVGEPRVWVLLAHVYERAGVSEADLIRGYLDRAGQCLAEHARPGGALLLYDLSTP